LEAGGEVAWSGGSRGFCVFNRWRRKRERERENNRLSLKIERCTQEIFREGGDYSHPSNSDPEEKKKKKNSKKKTPQNQQPPKKKKQNPTQPNLPSSKFLCV